MGTSESQDINKTDSHEPSLEREQGKKSSAAQAASQHPECTMTAFMKKP